MRHMQGNSHVLQRLFNWLRYLPPDVQCVILLTIYTVAGVALKEVASVFETAEEITPWDPSSSLQFVLLLGFGLRYIPALVLIPLVDNLVITPSDIRVTYVLLVALCVMVCYGTASAILLN